MTMDKVTFIEIEQNGKMVQHALIDHGNGNFTSMLKSTYDEQQAALSTPMINDEPATKSK